MSEEDQLRECLNAISGSVLYTVDQSIQDQIDQIHPVGEAMSLGDLSEILAILPNPGAPVLFEYNKLTFSEYDITPESLMYSASLGLRQQYVDTEDTKTVRQLIEETDKMISPQFVSHECSDRCRFSSNTVIRLADDRDSFLVGVEVGTNGTVYLIIGDKVITTTIVRRKYE
jgi:hypothetical protein